MALWSVDFTIEAQEDLTKLSKSVRSRASAKIEWLRENLDLIKPLPLGYNWQGFFKLRIGDWRVVYEIDYPVRKITIHHIENRDKVYRKQ